MDYENFKESFTEALQEDLYGKGIEARFDMKSVEKLNNEGYDAVTITPADSNIGVTLNGIESELVVIDRGTKTERDTFTVADHLCKVRGIKCVCISARNDPEIICMLIKKALRSIHIYITSDNMADIETARRRFEQWRKQR